MTIWHDSGQTPPGRLPNLDTEIRIQEVLLKWFGHQHFSISALAFTPVSHSWTLSASFPGDSPNQIHLWPELSQSQAENHICWSSRVTITHWCYVNIFYIIKQFCVFEEKSKYVALQELFSDSHVRWDECVLWFSIRFFWERDLLRFAIAVKVGHCESPSPSPLF